MNNFNVEFYTTNKGNKPAQDFLLSLDIKMRAKLIGLIQILEEKGNLLREPYSKYLDDGIFEIRVKTGSNVARVLYFFYYGKRIILTNGFIKKTQKTPKQELEKARKYRTEFLLREKNDE
ncbi:MAG: type II toxin-antitoxin system RelE/ParE family toxin [Clostridiales bacterium]|nr:type II toxin-antitoxin system RelE/ParE family toxin [Clostridiales bacterium]